MQTLRGLHPIFVSISPRVVLLTLHNCTNLNLRIAINNTLNSLQSRVLLEGISLCHDSHQLLSLEKDSDIAINNLGNTITKTAAQTMKIIYTLTDIDEEESEGE